MSDFNFMRKCTYVCTYVRVLLTKDLKKFLGTEHLVRICSGWEMGFSICFDQVTKKL